MYSRSSEDASVVRVTGHKVRGNGVSDHKVIQDLNEDLDFESE